MLKLINLLTMFGPLSAAKFWVAIVMAFVQFIQVYTGYDFGLDQETVTAILTGLTAFMVWLIPNKKPAGTIVLDTSKFPPAPGGLY